MTKIGKWDWRYLIELVAQAHNFPRDTYLCGDTLSAITANGEASKLPHNFAGQRPN